VSGYGASVVIGTSFETLGLTRFCNEAPSASSWREPYRFELVTMVGVPRNGYAPMTTANVTGTKAAAVMLDPPKR